MANYPGIDRARAAQMSSGHPFTVVRACRCWPAFMYVARRSLASNAAHLAGPFTQPCKNSSNKFPIAERLPARGHSTAQLAPSPAGCSCNWITIASIRLSNAAKSFGGPLYSSQIPVPAGCMSTKRNGVPET